MDFNLLPRALDARLDGALSRARSKIKAAAVIAKQVRADASEEAAQCRDDRDGLAILQDYFAAAACQEQVAQERAVCDLLSELIGIRLAAGDDPAEVARELKLGLPPSIREQIEAVVPLTPSTLGVLGVAIEQQCEKCWGLVERRGPAPEPMKKRSARGVPPDVADHALVVSACQPFGDNWRSHLVEICHRLDGLKAKFPKGLDERGRLSSWRELADVLRDDQNKPAKEKLVQYLRYRLNWQRAQVSLP